SRVRAPGVAADHPDGVGDHVVQLPGDPQPLLVDPAAGLLLPGPLGPLGPAPPLRPVRPPCPARPPAPPGRRPAPARPRQMAAAPVTPTSGGSPSTMVSPYRNSWIAAADTADTAAAGQA